MFPERGKLRSGLPSLSLSEFTNVRGPLARAWLQTHCRSIPLLLVLFIKADQRITKNLT